MTRSLPSVKPAPRSAGSALRAPLLAWLLFAFASVVFAEKTAEAGDDFLEYLGSMENDNDNWSDFAEPRNTQDNMTSHSHQSTSAASKQASDDPVGAYSSSSARSRK